MEGKACACTFGHYNSSAVSAGRSIQCLAHDWRMDSLLTDAQCEPCSDVECAVCGNGLKVLAGWQAFGTPANVFRCPFEDGCLDDGRGCSVGYTGTLCGVCDTGYDQLHRSCKLCTETGTQTALVFFGLIGIGSVAWVGWWLHSKSTTAVGRGLRTQLTVDNPVHGGEYILEAKSDTGTQQTHPSSLFRMLYHPGRIMIGFFQVVTQIGPVTSTPCFGCCALHLVNADSIRADKRPQVLHLDFPETMQRLLDALRPLAADLQSLLQIKCLGEFDYYSIWLIRTLLLPVILVAGVLVWYIRERRIVNSEVALERCRGNLFVVVFFIYP